MRLFAALSPTGARYNGIGNTPTSAG